ncbi:hypothetical protein SAMD00019534_020490, partial [Acytostelium subglobosum LB1]|uniref:hypothetical protein n=1 Tax=Acytostelium subglobosum LB1 TaxID=1410327 RepID=UPI000644D886
MKEIFVFITIISVLVCYVHCQTLNNLYIYVDPSSTYNETLCGSSANISCPTIQDALNSYYSNNPQQNDTMVNIILAPGKYINTVDKANGAEIYHGTNVTIVSEFEDQPAEIMLNGRTFLFHDGMLNYAPFTSVNLTNININGGHDPRFTDPLLLFNGYASPINVTLNRVNVYNSSSYTFMIEINNLDTNMTLYNQSYLTITNSTFKNNANVLSVLFIEGITAFIDNCTFDNNTQFGAFNFPVSSITVTNSNFSNNQLATELMFSADRVAQLTMDNCVIVNNTDHATFEICLMLFQNINFTMSNTLIINNDVQNIMAHSNYDPPNVFNLINVTVSGGLQTDQPFIDLVGGNMTFNNVHLLNGQRLLNCPLTCKLLSGEFSCPTKHQLPKHLGWIIAGSVLGFIFVAFMAFFIWRKVKMNRQQYQSIQ